MARRRTQQQAPTDENPASEGAAPETTDETPETPDEVAAPAATPSPGTPEEKMTALKQSVVDAKAAEKVAKTEQRDANKAHKTAKAAADPDDQDTLLAAIQAEQVAEAAKKTVIATGKKVKTAQGKVEKEVERQNVVKSQRANDEGFLTTIKNEAKEIKTRLDKASKLESDADDHRLAAAIKMGEVHGQFETKHEAKSISKGVTFKGWCEQHSIVAPDIRGRSWENVRKLLAVGRAEDPQQALTDMREGNKAAVKKHRDKTETKVNTGGSSDGSTPPAETAFAKIQSALGTMKDEEAANAVKSIAEARGFKTVAKDTVIFNPTASNAIKLVKDAIALFSPSERMSLAGWLTERIEADITAQEAPPAPATDGDPLDIPEGLRR